MRHFRFFTTALIVTYLTGAAVHAAELKATVSNVAGDTITLTLAGKQAPAEGDTVSFTKQHPVLGPIALGTGKVTSVRNAPEIIVRRTGGQGDITAGVGAIIDAPKPVAIQAKKETVERPVAAKTEADTDLIKAAKKGDTKRALRALRQGANVNAAIGSDWTALMWAAYKGDHVLVKALLKAGAKPDLESRGDPPRTALKLAAHTGRIKAAGLLLKHGADINLRGRAFGGYLSQAPAISYAAERKQPDMITFLIGKGADVELESGLGMTPLIYAAGSGKLASVNALLNTGALSDRPTSLGFTPLMAASNNLNGWGLVAYLLGAGADPNRVMAREAKKLKPEAPGMTALMIAATEADEMVAYTLLVGGADPSLKRGDGKTAADLVAGRLEKEKPGSRDHRSMVRLRQALLDPRNAKRIALAAVARRLRGEVRDKNIPIVLAAFRVGIHPNTMVRGKPLFFSAVKSGNPDMVSLFLKHGADPTIKDVYDHTAIREALDRDNFRIAGMLLKAGADPNAADREDRRTLLHRYAARGKIPRLTFLLKAGAKTGVRDTYGDTPLHRAAGRGKLDAFKTLLRYHANPKLRNKNGKTPLDMVSRRNRAAFVKALR